MKKIYQVRHMEQMLLLARRMKRQSRTPTEESIATKLVVHYESLLLYVQDQ